MRPTVVGREKWLRSLRAACPQAGPGRSRAGPLRLAALVGITVTATVLAAIHQPNGAAEVTVNTIVPYVAPVNK